MDFLSSLIREPSLKGVDMDGPDRIHVHRQLLNNKPLLRRVFKEFHALFWEVDNAQFSASGIRLELGAGVAAMRENYPQVWATDIVEWQGLDKVIDAQKMDLEAASVRTIYGQNCFHHFPQPELFFEECVRVLKPGGGIILLEPYYGPIAELIFKRLFTTEGFDKNADSWRTPQDGPMSGANQALSYIVFTRDRAEFHTKYPQLEIIDQKLCTNHLSYLLSGGLNFRQLMPNWASGLLTALQYIVSPLNRWIALHHVVVIRKKIS